MAGAAEGWSGMFVYSIKTSKKQILSMLVCVVMLIAILIVVIAWPGGETSAQTFSPVAAADDTERIGFLRDLGYEVTPQSVEVREVLIPDEFDEVFTQYNDLQKTAGMDLEPYHGKRVKCWTYTVLNYPGEEGVLAHLYIYSFAPSHGILEEIPQRFFRGGDVWNGWISCWHPRGWEPAARCKS